MAPIMKRWLGSFLPGVLILSLAGCNILGLAAVADRAAGDTPVEASYKGLKGQKVGIMCWADTGIVIDHPSVQGDISGSLQAKLDEAARDGADETKQINWKPSQEISNYQQAHPEFAADPAEQIAPKLGITRLIYIEITSLSLHSPTSPDLARGSATGNVKVVEVENGTAKVVFQENSIAVDYPKNAPPDGLETLRDDEVYQQTIGALTTALSERFIRHVKES
jgi:hypothetical protein